MPIIQWSTSASVVSLKITDVALLNLMDYKGQRQNNQEHAHWCPH